MPEQAPERRPLILVRGFGGLGIEDERRIAYQGFNDGTVYPQKRGENYIYEGMVLRFLKAGWDYYDATNVVGYYQKPITDSAKIPDELKDLPAQIFSGDSIVVDPGMALHLHQTVADLRRTIWVFRYYDLERGKFSVYGLALKRLIDLIRQLARLKHPDQEPPKVNIIAHSMGGLIVREAIQVTYPDANKKAEDHIHKVVTLGTPHKGISFQVVKNWIALEAEQELERFNPDFQKSDNKASAINFHEHFPLERLLCVVGTNYRSYGIRPASWMNRFFSVSEEFGLNYNRSDGLVKQELAQIDGAPRTFVHKCHGGEDSLVTSREAFEIATRFFFGDIRVRLRLKEARVLRGKDRFGKSEYFFGVSIKPRGVDFDLFHQSPEAENCYGPFSNQDLSDPKVAFDWAGPGRLIWEGWLDTSRIMEDKSRTGKEIVMRLDFYVGERDLLGVGFSDNVIFRGQYYVRAVLPRSGQPSLYRHENEDFVDKEVRLQAKDRMDEEPGGWSFQISGTGFEATLSVELERLAAPS